MGTYLSKFNFIQQQNQKKQQLDEILELSMTQENTDNFFVLDYNSISTLQQSKTVPNNINDEKIDGGNIIDDDNSLENASLLKTNYSDLLNTTLSEKEDDVEKDSSDILNSDMSSIDSINSISEWNTIMDLSKTVF